MTSTVKGSITTIAIKRSTIESMRFELASEFYGGQIVQRFESNFGDITRWVDWSEPGGGEIFCRADGTQLEVIEDKDSLAYKRKKALKIERKAIHATYQYGFELWETNDGKKFYWYNKNDDRYIASIKEKEICFFDSKEEAFQFAITALKRT